MNYEVIGKLKNKLMRTEVNEVNVEKSSKKTTEIKHTYEMSVYEFKEFIKESFKISDNEKIVGWYSQSDKIIVNTEPLTEFDKITDFRGIFPGNSDK